ncbi:hypothetical protein PPACK8108_LOCUS11979 [Phakopsora pachyrhizi]|uniref:Uncharacterized protein n=1 Tax=Phakopsora pachyrhizi TaxID=170000 RepID=A0AAV0B116_PHAPC|nr:hypothetical protein PPACK8108_LOCUS11979 [Phakopsora pachyrhizi]
MSICNRGHRLIEEQSLDPPIRRRFPKNQAHSGYKFGQNPFCKGEEMGEFTSSAFKEAFWSDEEFLSTAIDEISEPDGDDIPATGRNKNRSRLELKVMNHLMEAVKYSCKNCKKYVKKGYKFLRRPGTQKLNTNRTECKDFFFNLHDKLKNAPNF